MRGYRRSAARFVALTLAFIGATSPLDVLNAQAEARCSCKTEIPGTMQRALVLQAGGWLVDLDGTVLAARAELPMGRSGRWLFVPGFTYAHGYLRSPTNTGTLVPEALFHFQLSRGRVRPYVGGGAGLSLANLLDRTIVGVMTVGAGLRTDLTAQWGARLEADMRIFGDFEAGSVGWGLGVARRF
jgi:hypothetical protein